MLHPRAPPLIRALPHVESLSLFQAEESQDELETRSKMGIVTLNDVLQPTPATTEVPAGHVSTATAHAPTPPPAPTPVPLPGRALPINNPSFVGIPQTQVIAASDTAAEPSVKMTQQAPRSLIDSTQTVPAPHQEPPHVAVFSPREVPVEAVTSLAAMGPPTSVLQAAAAPVQVAQAVAMEEDEDDPMPGIDMDSDSDY